MADKKVSQLTALTGAGTASGDLLYIVDVSEPVAADQSKKITLTEFQSAPVSAGTANGVAYLNASKVLTTGSALTFDGTNFATTGTSTGLRLIASSTDAGGSVLQVDTTATAYGRVGGSTTMGYVAGTQSLWTIGGTEQMRLTSTGLGIGTSSPGAKLQVTGGGKGTIFGSNAALNFYSAWQYNSTDVGYIGNGASVVGAAAATDFGLTAFTGGKLWLGSNNGASYAVLDTSGNLGLGVTPSAWSGYHAIQMGAYANFYNTNAGQTGLATSTYNNGTNWIYNSNNPAFRYEQDLASQSHRWFIAPIGTAGNAISFTQAMTLDASTNLLLGTTAAVASGTGMAIYSATSARLQLRNSTTGDGTGDGAGLLVFGSDLYVENRENGATLFFNNGSERARITSVGNFSLGGTADRATTVGTKALNIFDGTAPVGTLANGISIYSSSGEAYVMDAAGNATLFSPHDAETNEWIFRSKHTPTGKVLRIDVERLLRFVNDHFGLDAVKEFVEE
jgi:hypothetical protein